MKAFKTLWAATLLAIGVGASAQTVPIQFNPNGTGSTGALTVGTLDWAVGNAVALGGVPVGGLIVGSPITVLSQARLALLQDPNGAPLTIPAGVEITFVAGFGETVSTCTGAPCNNATFVFDPTRLSQNFFEIWVKKTPTAIASNLLGTGFNTSKRIMFGTVNDASGNFTTGRCLNGATTDQFDRNQTNDWGNQLTLCGVGGTSIAVQVISIDPDYFPGFTPEQVASLKAQFNTSTVDPYREVDPSRQFIGNDAGADGLAAQPYVIPTLGPVNGFNGGTSTLDFQFQADANQSFTRGVDVPGACRVTYGGNDRNGNIAPNSFGEACMKATGNTENCYTFGGQVGAPTANPAFGGPFGEHTHHQVSGPAGDFIFRAGTHSAPKTTRITATACYDPGACRQAEANAGFKQIDFEGTGSFRNLSDTAKAYLKARGAVDPQPDNASDRIYYFRVDMDDTGEPGNKASKNKFDVTAANNFLAADKNLPLNDPAGDPLLETYGACNTMADVYQIFICKDATRCVEKDAIYSVRGFLTGGNIQLHKVIK